MTRETNKLNVAEIVTASIVEALLVSPEKVIPSARLISDLDTESIDVVDIRFRIEQAIGSRIDQKAMTESLGTNLTAETFDKLFTVKFIIDHVQQLLDRKK
jgi:acyl carrier protein